MATAWTNDEWRTFLREQDNRLGRYNDFEGDDPFDRLTEHDDDETDDYALYRLGIK